MLLTRREVLSKLMQVAIIAPIAPKLLGSIAATIDAPTSISSPVEDYPKLTLGMLEESYQICTYGYDEPDILIMAPDTYAEFMATWYSLPDSARYLRGDNEVTCPYFNGAAVTFAKALPRGSWMMLNSNNDARRRAMKKGWTHPDDQVKLSGYFNKIDRSWHPIPTTI